MSQSETSTAPKPSGLRLRRKSAVLELDYADGNSYSLSAELLRVYSPSAEVRGHGMGQAVLQTGKRHVGLSGAEPVGSYGIRLIFDDGHDSGIYSWDYLFQLATDQEALWQDYLERLHAARASRDPLPPDTQVITIVDPARKS